MLNIGAMLMEVSALSYLGLGVKTPMAEWGDMMNLGKSIFANKSLVGFLYRVLQFLSQW